MKNSMILLFLSTVINSFSQTQEYLYKNDFTDKILNEEETYGEGNIIDLKDGYLFSEQTKDNYYWCIAERIFIDYEQDYEIEIKMKPYNYSAFDAEFGILFGLRNVNMFHSLVANPDGYVKIGTQVYTQYTPYLNWTDMAGVKPSNGWYIFKLVQKDKKMYYYVNGVLVYEKKIKMLGRWFGWYTNSKMGLQLDYFYVKQKRGAIKISDEAKDVVKEKLSGINTSDKDETCPMLAKDGKNLYFKRLLKKKNDFRFDDGEGSFYKCPVDTTVKTGIATRIKNNTFESPWYISSIPDDKGFYAGEKDNMMSMAGSGITFLTESTGYPDYNKLVKFTGGNLINIRHACIADNEKVMVLSGYDEYEPYGMDLYVSTKTGNSWSQPVKISSLNTKGDEITPFITKDMKKLYFSSDGHPGYGFSDVFVSTRLDDTWLNWSTPENMGKPVNDAAYNEAFMKPDTGNLAFMASTSGNINNLDISRVRLKKIPEEPIVLRGKIIYSDGIAHDIKSVEIVFKSKDIPREKLNVDKKDDSFTMQLKKDDLFTIHLLDTNYIVTEQRDLTTLGKTKERLVDIKVTKIGRGESFVLENIYFSPNHFDLLSTSYPALDMLYTTMKNNPKLKIEIQGHTSKTNEGESFNVELSTNRALAVKNYLVNKGISEKRIQSIGYGYSKPLSTDSSEEIQAKNRRVEIKILDK